MKFATVLMSLMFAGVFAQAQGTPEAGAAPAEVKQEVKAPEAGKVAKAEKKHKHGKKEKAEGK